MVANSHFSATLSNIQRLFSWFVSSAERHFKELQVPSTFSPLLYKNISQILCSFQEVLKKSSINSTHVSNNVLYLKTKHFRTEHKIRVVTQSSVYTKPRPIFVQGHVVFKDRIRVQSQNSLSDTTY
jgi:hypothetical protein